MKGSPLAIAANYASLVFMSSDGRSHNVQPQFVRCGALLLGVRGGEPCDMNARKPRLPINDPGRSATCSFVVGACKNSSSCFAIIAMWSLMRFEEIGMPLTSVTPARFKLVVSDRV
jgi:hypothetical protein